MSSTFLDIQIVDMQRQSGGDDCGLFAIASALCLFVKERIQEHIPGSSKVWGNIYSSVLQMANWNPFHPRKEESVQQSLLREYNFINKWYVWITSVQYIAVPIRYFFWNVKYR